MIKLKYTKRTAGLEIVLYFILSFKNRDHHDKLSNVQRHLCTLKINISPLLVFSPLRKGRLRGVSLVISPLYPSILLRAGKGRPGGVYQLFFPSIRGETAKIINHFDNFILDNYKNIG